MTATRLVCALGLFAGLSACGPEAQCDECTETATSAGDTGNTSETSETIDASSTGDSSGPDTPTPACAADLDVATAWIEQNDGCQSMLDCAQLEALCYTGELAGPCRGISVSTAASPQEWAELDSGLEAACGDCAPVTCTSVPMCTDAGRCESSRRTEAYCASIERDIEAFVAANRSCQTDADCTDLASACHVDECSGIAVNTSADAESWERLDRALFDCDHVGPGPTYCNFVGECGFEVVCNEQGQCEALF